ncbi:MAG: HAD family phosphatase, partial [Clostridia bacterium]|nr:HAD family phosphatase [Clostridia bacterium]
MKKLYISDLDGTLLQNDCTLSEATIKIINKFIADGGYFSFSTARSPASVSEFVRDIKLNIPLILMNGAMIYDIQKMKCIKIEFMEKNHINAV